MAIQFKEVGSFGGLANPTSLQFGPDNRLYVSEQGGLIKAFSVAVEDGQYTSTGLEEIDLIQDIQNHNDDGSLSGESKRQVTGILVTGTADNPVLYVSSSDPRISVEFDVGLDTNSGVVTRLTWTGNSWEAVDIIRGLPRSEENHANNGMVLSPDGSTLYLAVGGNTNNGAPSKFFSYTGEYALSGTVLEIDLLDLNSRPVLTDNAAGQNGRKYIYDLPTLDDPNVPNITDGVGEDANGLDEAGPWGGNDGFNMAILPSDAPLRIYADGFRNHYDLVLTESGKLYTVDNGSNSGLGGNPIISGGEATNQINNGGSGDPEPLFLIEEDGYYGHPAPVRANQNLAWTVYDNNGNPNSALSINSVADLSSRVPDSLAIADGFLIDPSKFTGNAARLQESGVRIEYNSSQSPSLVNIGSSSNGLVEYTGDAFGGELKGDLLVAQFNGNVARLNLSADGTQATYETISGLGGRSLPLDVTVGPDGTVWAAELGGGKVSVFAPSDLTLQDGSPTQTPNDTDFDNDGIDNAKDPFIRDDSNGQSVTLFPGQTLLWDFDPNQDNNRPGPSGYGGGLTGVMVDGTTDFEEFFQGPSTLANQNIRLDNVKFITAAGGGTSVIENVSNGTPRNASAASGEYLFHTGLTVSPIVENFTVKWTVYNPAQDFTGTSQEIGGYLGTGDQSNYLALTTSQDSRGELKLTLENNDITVQESFIQANDLFSVPVDQKIFLELEINPTSGTAKPVITYETGNGASKTVSGSAISLAGTAVLDVIKGNYEVEGKETGIAVGLFSTNSGQPAQSTFQAIFDDIEVTAEGTSSNVLYRVNAGGPDIAAIDGGIKWSSDQNLTTPASTNSFPVSALEPGPTVSPQVPSAIFDSERWDPAGGPEMQWSFPVPEAGLYEVRLLMGNGFSGTAAPGQRIFNIDVEGQLLGDIDLSQDYGHLQGGMFSHFAQVNDGELNIEFIHGVENPLINGIEILKVNSNVAEPQPITTTTDGEALFFVTENSNNVQISNFGDSSFQIQNTGNKKITQVELDVTQALYPDSVFDPLGIAGDTVSKPLTINSPGSTGVVSPSTYDPYIGSGGINGYQGLKLLFDTNVSGGFEPGETIGFSVDMDPNSVAGAAKGPLDAGTSPSWDVGGVSGAELIGSEVTVTFEDGTTGKGQLQGNNNQAGAKALISQEASTLSPSLKVNGLNPGNLGTYSNGGPNVVISGPAGQTARVVLTKGFIQPITNEFSGAYKAQLDSQLAALAASDFPANNAVEFQTVDVVLNGSSQDISALFDFDGVSNYNFAGEDQLPLGFVTSLIDPQRDDLAIGPVSQPIYLEYQTNPPIATNNYPTTTGLADVSVVEDAANTVINLYPAFADAETSDANLAYSIIGNTDSSLFSSTSINTAGQLILDYAPGKTGSSTLTVQARDEAGANVTTSFAVDVQQQTVTPVPITTPNNATALKIEAESIANTTNYRLENNAIASNGTLLSLVGGSSGETGTATFTFTGASGVYDLQLATFDESDGIANFQIEKNDTLVSTIQLDANPGGNAISPDTAVTRVINSLSIATGDIFTITGNEKQSEHARLDFVEFLPVGSTAVNQAPTSSGIGNVAVVENANDTLINLNAAFADAETPDSQLVYRLIGNTNTSLFTSASINTAGQLILDYAPGVSGSSTLSVEAQDIAGETVDTSFNVVVTPATVTPPVTTPTPNNATALKIEAESITNTTGYRLENNGVASNGAMLSLVGEASGETGTATFTFTGVSGNYNLNIGTFDESDGNATIEVEQTRVSNSSVELIRNDQITLDDNPGGNAATPDTQVTRAISSRQINTGDIFTITGNELQSEHARLDFVEFLPIGVPAANQAPTSSGISNVAVLEDASNTLINLNTVFADAETPDSQLIYGLTQNTNTSLFTSASINAAGQLILDYAPGASGSAELTVQAQDAAGATAETSFEVVVTPSTVTPPVVTPPVVTPPVIPPTNATELKVEVEDLANVQNYGIESNDAASGGKLLSLLDQNTAAPGVVAIPVDTLTGFVTGASYDISLAAFDEGDGESNFIVQLTQNDLTTNIIGSVDLNQPGGSWGAFSSNLFELGVASGVKLEAGDVLTVQGFRNNEEYARLDFLKLTPSVIV